MPPKNDPGPHISYMEPLPALPEPQGRWGDVYKTEIGGTDMWTCSTRRPLTEAERRAGLTGVLVAASESLLVEQVKAEEERYEAYRARCQWADRGAGI